MPSIKIPRPASVKSHAGNAVGTRKTVPRLIRLAELIRQGKCPPAEHVAVEFETSARTIERDIEFLRDQCKMEFIFDRAKNVYRATTPTVSLPAMQLTVPEIMSLLIACRSLQFLPGAGLYELATSAIEKITTFMTDEQLEEWKRMDALITYLGLPSASPTDATIFPTISQAMRDCEEVEILYRSRGKTASDWRLVRPLHLYIRNNRCYLFAQTDETQIKGRRYVVSRIKGARRLGTHFDRPSDFTPESVTANTVGLYGGDNPEPIRLRLSPVAADWLEECPLHASQRIEQKPDGTWELTATIAINPELEGVLLRWGMGVEILEPPKLKEAVLGIARAMVERG